MPSFLRTSELRRIQNDFEKLLLNPEALDIVAEYATWVNPSASTIIDPVYGIDDRPRNAVLSRVSIRAIQQIVTQFDVKLLRTGLVEAGDSIFYCSTRINLDSLIPDLTIVPGTMVFIDPVSQRWIADSKKTQDLKSSSRLIIGNGQISQAVICQLEKR